MACEVPVVALTRWVRSEYILNGVTGYPRESRQCGPLLRLHDGALGTRRRTSHWASLHAGDIKEEYELRDCKGKIRTCAAGGWFACNVSQEKQGAVRWSAVPFFCAGAVTLPPYNSIPHPGGENNSRFAAGFASSKIKNIKNRFR